jgi:8-oxo-dGTP pyrophosphatase MutT (NUDIX family)
VHQRRPYGVFWEVPSGYVEAGESFEQATAREVLEEAAVAVEVGPLVCTLVWEREHDRRRNVLAYFEATPLDAEAVPRPQVEEEIDEAAYLDPLTLGDALHPLERPVVQRWWNSRTARFHLHADVTVNADGTQSYRFR